MALEFTSFCSFDCHKNITSSVLDHIVLILGGWRTAVLCSRVKGLNVTESFREVAHLDYESKLIIFNKNNMSLIEPPEDMSEE